MPRRPIREFDEFIAWLGTRGWTAQTVIDVGACYGTLELLQGYPEARHILFEPVAELEERMKAICARYDAEYHMVALGAEEGTLPMAVPEGAAQGATLAVRPGATVREVPIRTLDGMFGDRELAGPILLKTDCQGYDLAVMKGGEAFLKRVDVVVMEVNMFHPAGNPDLPDFGEIVTWMRERGFAVFDIISYQIRPFDDALGYVDLVFVPESGPLRAHHRWA